MEEEDIQGRAQGVIPIVPKFALLSRLWAGKSWPAAGVINTGERMRGSHRGSQGNIYPSPLPCTWPDQEATGQGLGLTFPTHKMGFFLALWPPPNSEKRDLEFLEETASFPLRVGGILFFEAKGGSQLGEPTTLPVPTH